jgi:hypothetical protein
MPSVFMSTNLQNEKNANNSSNKDIYVAHTTTVLHTPQLILICRYTVQYCTTQCINYALRKTSRTETIFINVKISNICLLLFHEYEWLEE